MSASAVTPKAELAQLRIDRVACTGRGLCAAVVPERIALDEWGYPIVSPEPVSATAVAEAVRICPRQAVRAQPLPSS